jgi:hypothetical protein
MASTGSGQDPVAVFFELVNEPSLSIKGEVFLDQLSEYQLTKKASVPWSWAV